MTREQRIDAAVRKGFERFWGVPNKATVPYAMRRAIRAQHVRRWEMQWIQAAWKEALR